MSYAIKRLRNQKGFTLVELLVVIAILAVLAAIVVPRVVNNIGKAREAADNSNVAMLQSSVERYFVANNSFPVTGTDADTAAGTGTIDTATLVSGNYIAAAPADPWGGATPRAYRMDAGVVQPLGVPGG